MQVDTIRELLNLPAGWLVTKVLSYGVGEIRVLVQESVMGWQRCEGCGRSGWMGSKGCFETLVQDLALGTRRVYLHVEHHRYRCKGCKRSWSLEVPWIRSESRVTLRYAEQVFRLTSITTNAEAGWYLGHDDEKVYRIDKGILKEKAAQLLEPTPAAKNISVDEVSWKKWYRYLTNVVDTDRKKVIWNSNGRKAEVLDKYYDGIGPENCQKVESVALDGARTYISSTVSKVPQALIVYDKFHVVQRLNKAVDAVRKHELRKARLAKEAELVEMMNCHSRFVLLKNKANRTEKEDDHLKRLCEINEPIYKAMLLKESFLEVYMKIDETSAAECLNAWLTQAFASGLEAFLELGVSFRDKAQYILNWFKKRISSAISEGINNKIKRLKRMAYGYRDVDYFLLKIHQHCGLLNPRSAQ